MCKCALQMAGLILGGIGLVGTCAVTGMPQWKVTAFIESNIIIFETLWEGLWMNCFRQANFHMQCKIHDSLLALTPDLKVGRALMCTAVAIAALGFMTAVIGIRCTKCIGNNERVRGFILLVAGIAFIIAGILVMIPVSWTANRIIRDFYNPLVNVAQKRELGEALYIGWASAFFLIAAAFLFFCFCLRTESKFRYYMPSKPTTCTPHTPHTPHEVLSRKTSSLYSRSQYV